MQAFRLLTHYLDETKNDNYAGIVIKRFSSLISDVEVTFISDSLGTTFFVQESRDKNITAVYYVAVIEFLDSLVKAVFCQSKIAENLRLI